MALLGAVAKIGAGMLKGRKKKQTGAQVAAKVTGKSDTVYLVKANPNATSSELDAKKIVPVAASTENISKSQGSRTTSLKESALRIKTTTIEVNIDNPVLTVKYLNTLKKLKISTKLENKLYST